MIKAVEFTHDIEKPHLLSPIKSKNSLKKSKTQDQYDIGSNNQSADHNTDVEKSDLIRKRFSSDDEEYILRRQNANQKALENQQNIDQEQLITTGTNEKNRESKRIHHQNKNQSPSINSNGNVKEIIEPHRPIPPNRNGAVGLKRRPIPINNKQYNSPNNSIQKVEYTHQPKFKPRPPGSPKEPISPTIIKIKDIQQEYYSYSSYAESQDEEYSYSSENNTNLPTPSLNNQNLKQNSNSNIVNDQNLISNTNPDQQSNSNITTNQAPNLNTNSEPISQSNIEIESIPIQAPKITEKYFYRMEKTTISRIPKKKKKYVLSLGNKSLIEAIYSKKKKKLPFDLLDAKSGSLKPYTLLLGNQNSSLSLRNGSIYDTEIFSMRLVDVKKPFHYISVFLHSFVQLPGLPNNLVNQPPNCDLDSPESIEMVFGKRNNSIIPTKSNWIFYSPDNEELIAVMKESKTTVIIETVPGLVPPMLFTIALAAFIGKVDKS